MGQKLLLQESNLAIAKVVDEESTVWKFQTFSITQILREINFWDSRSTKSTILPHLEAVNFDFYEFCTLDRLKLTKLTKIRSSKIAKKAELHFYNPLD